MNKYYNLSKDYKLLFKLLCLDNDIVAYVDYLFESLKDKYIPSRDICVIKRKKAFDISFGVRGKEYSTITDFFSDSHSEYEIFVAYCENMNLEWIKNK